MDEKEEKSEGKSKPLEISNLIFIRDRVSVKCSGGLFYVRQAKVSDFFYFASVEDENSRKLGERIFRALVSDKEEEGEESEHLDINLFGKLTDEDIQCLAKTIVEQNDWGALPKGDTLEELGKAALDDILKYSDSRKRLAGLAEKYSFLSNPSLNAIQEAARKFESLSFNSRVLDSLNSPSVKAMQEAVKGIDIINSRAVESIYKNNLDERAQIGGLFKTRPNEPPLRLPRIPKQEETPVGKAALESAESARITAQKVDALAEAVGEINSVIVHQVLPQWFKHVQETQKSSQHSIEQAASSLWWTKWAVIISVVVSVVTASWQVYVTRSVDKENTAVQLRIEEVLKRQLETQLLLNVQQSSRLSRDDGIQSAGSSATRQEVAKWSRVKMNLLLSLKKTKDAVSLWVNR